MILNEHDITKKMINTIKKIQDNRVLLKENDEELKKGDLEFDNLNDELKKIDNNIDLVKLVITDNPKLKSEADLEFKNNDFDLEIKYNSINDAPSIITGEKQFELSGINIKKIMAIISHFNKWKKSL